MASTVIVATLNPREIGEVNDQRNWRSAYGGLPDLFDLRILETALAISESHLTVFKLTSAVQY